MKRVEFTINNTNYILLIFPETIYLSKNHYGGVWLRFRNNKIVWEHNSFYNKDVANYCDKLLKYMCFA